MSDMQGDQEEKCEAIEMDDKGSKRQGHRGQGPRVHVKQLGFISSHLLKFSLSVLQSGQSYFRVPKRIGHK